MFYKKEISKFFKFDNLKTTFKKEIIGGLTTFLAMIYILSNAPSINPNHGTMHFGGIFISTAIALHSLEQWLCDYLPICPLV